ncbi:hypothetical protein CCP4SC76_5210003 [Gammaproteobacteria bacterium]
MILPWKRCLADLQEGKVDGAFPASFKPDRLAQGSYPMTGDQPDATRRLHEGLAIPAQGLAFLDIQGITVVRRDASGHPG